MLRIYPLLLLTISCQFWDNNSHTQNTFFKIFSKAYIIL